MKRNPRKPSPPSTDDRRELDARRLSHARGGGLDITVHVPQPFDPGMQLQHNELLVRC